MFIKNTNLLPPESRVLPDASMLKLDTVDSSNNYAMQLIDADTAAHGLTILADRQTAGRGQRGNAWFSEAGESLLMSIIVHPTRDLAQQPLFLADVARAIAEVVQACVPQQGVRVKWPNDIIIGDKKAGGILIENTVRGQTWQWAVIGFGLNVGQRQLPEGLPHSTSLRIASGESFDIEELAMRIRAAVLESVSAARPDALDAYNALLFRAGSRQQFAAGERRWEGTICGVNGRGQLLVRLADGSTEAYTHGSVEWVWET